MLIRNYSSSDYDQVVKLYKQSELFGGQFDQERDSKQRLQNKIESDPDAILVAEEAGQIVGTISLIEDGRVAWLFRFCVAEVPDKDQIAESLAAKAEEILRSRGHHQVLVYTSTNNLSLHQRYQKLGFKKGQNYACFWKNI